MDRTIAPPINEIENINLIPAKNIKLDNGIPVYYISSGSQEVVKIDWVFNAGTKFQNQNFLASTVLKTLLEGSAKFKEEEISEKLDFYGAYTETQITKDYASFTLYALNKHLEDILPIVQDVLVFPKFPEDKLKLYLQRAKQKYIISQEKVSNKARDIFFKEIYRNSTYKQEAIASDYDKITQKEIKAYFEKYYWSDAKIFVSGKVGDETLEQLSSHFGSVNVQKHEGLVVNFPDLIPQKIVIEEENAIQSAIRIGKPFIQRKHTDYIPFSILNVILGGYFGSRLMANIREDKGYTYGIGSINASLSHAGYFSISTEVGVEHTQATLDEIYKELSKLQNELVPEEELKMVKNYILGSFARNTDGAFDMMDRFKTTYLNDLTYDYYERYFNVVKTIEAKEIQEMANKYLKLDSLFEVVVGKIK